MFVKICGMTRLQDIMAAQRLGADAVGFIFAKSPRKISPEKVKELRNQLTGIKTVGVFVNEDLNKVRDIRDYCELDIIQLHGDESLDYCEKLEGAIFKAFRCKDENTIKRFKDYPSSIHILLDTYASGQRGGTGRQISFSLLDKIDDFSQIILAGGLGPENVGHVVKRYQPFGIDVNSKVEIEPGVKDLKKMQALFDELELT